MEDNEKIDEELDRMNNKVPNENSSIEEEKAFVNEMMSSLFGGLCGADGCKMPEYNIKFVKTLDDAKLPEYKSEKASGFDFYTPIDFTIKSNECKVINTGLKVADIPEGYEIQVRSRSGLAAKDQIFVLNTPGTIDNDYRNDIMIIMYNLGKDKEFHKGDRIAQGVVSSFEQMPCKFVSEDEITKTERGEGGLGSTGA